MIIKLMNCNWFVHYKII